MKPGSIHTHTVNDEHTPKLKVTKIVITARTRHAKRYCDLDGLLPRYLILHAFCQLLLMV